MDAKLSLTNEIYVSPQESGFIISDYFVYQGGKSQQLNAKLIYVDTPPSSPIKNSFTRGTGRREGGWEYISQSGSSVVMYMYVLPKEQDPL